MIRSIAHPTDFSIEGQEAFAHALKLAVLNRSRLDILHVHGLYDADAWQMFPKVREMLERWGILPAGSEIEDIAAKTGIDVRKVEIRDSNPSQGLSHYLHEHASELLVMASHGRTGLSRWLEGSVSAKLAEDLPVPVLLLGPNAKPFVDLATGELHLRQVLVPVAREPSPHGAIRALNRFCEGLGVRCDCVHAGPDALELHSPDGSPIPVRQLEGNPVEAILAEAGSAQLIAMPTAGRHGILDAIRGSTTEQVLHAAPCPVLALRAGD